MKTDEEIAAAEQSMLRFTFEIAASIAADSLGSTGVARKFRNTLDQLAGQSQLMRHEEYQLLVSTLSGLSPREYDDPAIVARAMTDASNHRSAEYPANPWAPKQG